MENGKRKTFVFRFPLGVGKRNRQQTESRDCLQTLPRCEGGKACVAGLKRKTYQIKTIPIIKNRHSESR